MEKLARWKNNYHFNLKCVRSNIVPKCFHLKSPIKGLVAERTISKIFGAFLGIGLFGVGAQAASIKILKKAADTTKQTVKGAATIVTKGKGGRTTSAPSGKSSGGTP